MCSKMKIKKNTFIILHCQNNKNLINKNFITTQIYYNFFLNPHQNFDKFIKANTLFTTCCRCLIFSFLFLTFIWGDVCGTLRKRGDFNPHLILQLTNTLCCCFSSYIISSFPLSYSCTDIRRLYYGLHENSYGSILTIHYFCLTLL